MNFEIALAIVAGLIAIIGVYVLIKYWCLG